jgi:hypothetical protein
MLVTGSIAASAEPTPTPTPSSSECSFGQHLAYIWAHLPANFRADIKHLKSLDPGQERRDAAKQIRQNALDGAYGAEIQKRAEWRKQHHGHLFTKLPDNLKADLKEVRAAANRSERVDLLEQISKNALDGDYGKRIQAKVERIEHSDRWQNCTV